MLGPMANTIALGATCFAGLGPLVGTALARIPATNIAICRIRDYDFVSFRLDRKKLRGLHSLHLVEDTFCNLRIPTESTPSRTSENSAHI